MKQRLRNTWPGGLQWLALAILATGMVATANPQSQAPQRPDAAPGAPLRGHVPANTPPDARYDLKQAGAKGDGSVDTTSITAAFTNARSAGGILHIPAGEFQTASPIIIDSDNFVVECDGMKSHLYTAGANALIHIAASGVRINGCNLENKNPTNPNKNVVVDVVGDGRTDLSIQNSSISGGDGIYTAVGVNLMGTNMKRINISGNTFAHLWAGVRGAPVAGDADPKEVIISDNMIHDVRGNGVTLNYPIDNVCCGHARTVPRGTAGQGFIISNNVIESLTPGPGDDHFAVAVAGATDVLITNNQLTARLEAVHVEDNASNVSVTNNVIFGSAANPCIKIYGSDHISVLGNQMRNCAAEGIFVNEGSANGGYSAQYFEVSHNIVNGCGTTGIRLSTGYRGPAYGRVSENLVTGCVDGFIFQDHLDRTEFSDNTATGNKGYGLNLNAADIKGSFRIGDGNVFTGNQSGEINYPTGSSDVSLQTYHTATTANTPGDRHQAVYGQTGMYLGNYAEGVLQVRVVNQNSNNFLDYTYHISWNGTALTVGEAAAAYVSGGPLDRVAPRVSRGYLQVGAFSALSDQGSKPDVLTFTVDFTGVLSAGGRTPAIHLVQGRGATN
jgi:hypothetical protein